jgi:hypothetical protein
MTNNFIIEKKIPIPKKCHPLKYPFYKMDIGDSFLVEVKDKCEIGAIRATCVYLFRKHRLKFITRSMGDKIRVWRVA